MQELETVLDLFTRTQFQFGIAGGLVLLVALYVTSSFRDEVKGWGLAVAAVVFVGINVFLERRLTVLAGLSIIALGGTMLRGHALGSETWERLKIKTAWVTIVVGVVLFTWRAGLPDLTWVAFVTPAVVVAIGYSLYLWIDSDHADLLGPLMAVTAIGLWTTVPETDTARVLLGAALPLSVATLNPIRARITPAGAFVLGTVFAWLVPFGGLARPASIIGGWACIGVIGLLPVVLRQPDARLRGGTSAMVLVHVVTVVLAARVIGLGVGTVRAVVAVVLLGLITFASLSVLVKEQTLTSIREP